MNYSSQKIKRDGYNPLVRPNNGDEITEVFTELKLLQIDLVINFWIKLILEF